MSEKRKLCIGICLAVTIAILITLLTSSDFSFGKNEKNRNEIWGYSKDKQEYQVDVPEKRVAKEYIPFDYEKIKKEIEGESDKTEEKKELEKIYENGAVERYSEIDGVKSGKAVLTFTNGDREEFNYVAGVLEGEATYYFKNGDREIYRYKNGVVEGKARYIFANGKEEKYNYKNGVRE
ncbi:hypothetical protein [Fusobacterium mortiferum]|uniref:hypothetical protein n=1 Tax=Fusobacterium mortiferum TaxID=850 RepID=UPI003F90AB43